jgi:hypothetical protein
MLRSAGVYTLFLSSICLLGCGSPREAGDATVQGKITFDGEPLARGLIQFRPDGAGGSIASIEIKDGEYHGRAFTGLRRVVLTAPKVIEKRKKYEDEENSPEVEVTVELLPLRYNRMSIVNVDIKPGTNEFDFALTSQ